jgi:hypothetical protein
MHLEIGNTEYFNTCLTMMTNLDSNFLWTSVENGYSQGAAHSPFLPEWSDRDLETDKQSVSALAKVSQIEGACGKLMTSNRPMHIPTHQSHPLAKVLASAHPYLIFLCSTMLKQNINEVSELDPTDVLAQAEQATCDFYPLLPS